MRKIPFTVSFEMRSPERGSALGDYLHSLKALMAFRPAFVSIANHQPAEKYTIDGTGNMKKSVKDRYPSTYFFAVALRDQFDIEVVPHLLCNELEPDSIDDILLGFHYVGIRKLMALRGDRNSNAVKFSNRYSYSSELVKHMADFNINHGGRFEIGIAGYPDVHPTAVSEDRDLFNLKNKIDLGASFIITQLFLDNQRFYDYLDKCRRHSIAAPVYPGLKIISHKSNIAQYRNRFRLKIPAALECMFTTMANKNDQVHTGQQWLFQQCEDLLNNGQTHLHFYVFSSEDIAAVISVLNRLKE
jgi:methylenetetrahydrofolate reductase (NADPH)